MKAASQFLPSIAPLAGRFDAFILDLWGVIHDGQRLYPKVKECLERLRASGKKIILLSNAPRRAQVVQEALLRMGIEAGLYDKVITSGETAYQCLAHPGSSFFKPRGKHYFYIGLEKDRKLLDGLHYEEAENPEFAQFVLLAHSYYDNQPFTELLPLLKRCLAQNLPVLCINPDTEIVRLDGEHVYCAGKLAGEYHMMGGEVLYFGKPHRAVYEACLTIFAGIDKSRIVAVGDNLATDIAGAHHTGLASVLVTGGLLRTMLSASDGKDYEAKCREMLDKYEIASTYVVPAFNW